MQHQFYAFVRTPVFLLALIASGSVSSQIETGIFLLELTETIEEENRPPIPLKRNNLMTRDPANHSCCIPAPPEALDLVWRNFSKLTLRSSNEAIFADFLPIEDIEVSSSGSLNGETRSTVAGFSNILTTLTGQITQSGVDLEIIVGAGGGLPSGEPIEFTLGTTFEGEFLLSSISSPVLGLQTASGAAMVRNWTIDPEATDDFNLHLSLDSNGSNAPADWFVIRLDPNGQANSFNLNTGQFDPGIMPTHQGALQDVSISELLRLNSPPAEGTIFAFGVDERDGQLNDNVEYVAIEVIYFQ